MEQFIEKQPDCLKKIMIFCSRYRNIYLYGAGAWGKSIFKYLTNNKIKVKAFLTTDGGDAVLSTNVYKYSEYKKDLSIEDGIIIAIAEEGRKVVMKCNNFPCDVLELTKKEFFFIEIAAGFPEGLFKRNVSWRHIDKNVKYDWQEILIVQLEVTFGDMIWSSAFVRELRRNYINAKITLILNNNFKSLYEYCPYVDCLLGYDCKDLSISSPVEAEKRVQCYIEKELSDKRFDAVFLPRLLPGSLVDAWDNVFFAIEISSEYRIAHALGMIDEFKNMSDFLEGQFSLICKHRMAMHEVENDLSMLKELNLIIKDDSMEVWVGDEDDEWARNVLCYINKICVYIAVALVGSHAKRSWEAYRYGNVFKRLVAKYQNVVFVLCGGNDAAGAAEIVKGYIPDNVIDLTGKTTLRQVAAVIKRCSMYVGSDTGLLHMASALHVPVVEISASNRTSPDYWGSSVSRCGPWRTKSIVLRPEKGLDGCGYCCQREYAHCINQITEEEVYQAICTMKKEIETSKGGKQQEGVPL